MRHRKKSEKFSRSRAQRKALVKSLLRAIFTYERITTTESKAKGIRKWIDKLITWAKEDTLHHRRLCYRWLEDHKLVKRLFEEIAPRFKEVNGGYTRIIDLGNRKDDGANMSILELTKIEKKEKVSKKKEERKKEEKPKEEQKEEKKGFVSGVKKIFKKER
jgi:large subunit ribosomal protein L17